MSGPHCARERESDFERLVGQNLWRLDSLVKQVGDFASSGKVGTVPCGEEPTRASPGAVFEMLLHTLPLETYAVSFFVLAINQPMQLQFWSQSFFFLKLLNGCSF